MDVVNQNLEDLGLPIPKPIVLSVKESKSFASNEKSNMVTEVNSPSNISKKASLRQETYNTQQTERTVEKEPTHVRYGTYRETYD